MSRKDGAFTDLMRNKGKWGEQVQLSSDFLSRIKDSNRIDDIMRQYVTLKRSGHIYKCLCPFHSERTPSCTVYPDSESFYCFGCGAGGDVITFIMKIENLDYIEAVKYLAEKSGIPMPEDGYTDRNAQIKKRTLEMNREAARFFYQNLKTPDGKEGLEYLINKRRLLPETIKSFGLGVATNHWTSLTNHMLSLGYTKQELMAASLITEKNGRWFDFFVNRVIFPIFDLRGNVIAFSGRTLEKESKGMKYLNSRGTPVYEKSKTLFALNFAKNTSVKSGRLILCEGNVDVISLHQAGFTEAVATCGTAITNEHARLMSQYCNEVYICYDADEAGQKATTSAISILTAAGIKTKVVKIAGDGVKDVDDYLNKLGAERFKLLLNGSEGAVAFELNKCRNGLDMDSELGKVEYLKRTVSVLAGIESKVEREIYISKLAQDYGVPKEALSLEVAAYIKKQSRSDQKKEWKKIESGFNRRDSINPDAQSHPKEAKAEEGIIAYVLIHPDSAKRVFQALPTDRFITSFYKKVYEKLAKCCENGEEVSLTALGGEFSPEEMGRISYILARSKDITIDSAALEDYIKVLMNALNTAQPASAMSDDEFLEYYNKLRQSK